MSTPEFSNDFSHLPTVDETRATPGEAAKTREVRRRTIVRPKAVAETPSAAPETVETPAEAAPMDTEAWQSLLEMEEEDPLLMSYARPQARAALVPAPQPAKEEQAPRAKTVVRAPTKSAAVAEEAPPQVEAPEERQEEEQAKEEQAKEEPVARGSGLKVEAPEVKVEVEAAPKSPWLHRWEKVGGSALGLSVAVHLIIMAGAAVYVVNKAMEPAVDFLPGGGTAQSQAASQALENKIQRKKNPWLNKSMPIRRLAAMDKISEISLPDAPDTFELPEAANQLLNSKLGAGMGLGGAGGGFGTGMGLGSRSGMVFQPLSMFGREIKAKKMALVLDVSASMAPHLPRVIEEVDRVAKDSVVVLYVGCGLEPPPPRGLDGEEVFRTSGPEFEKFWRMGGATLEEARKFKFSPKDPIPMEEIFRLLSRRPQTYFIHAVGLSYTWLALLSNEVRSADALYWFSDFQDTVNFRQVAIVKENLMNRKQKLYIHAYQRGSAFDLVVSQLVEPTKGDVIEAEP